ncbi:hypothetical protein AXK11_05840 [Cephaloticoccus primus]|uniref:Uncharacterized protein n=1 Tax=Cephaloticoccus primus TaxID=1548207 RepID=A0A139SMA5_9BACT|nr:DUF4198 domain-containing protein [Cephaloticoccus primus]KXU35639.1 hypothetical protein AXK11_05840 [Cephaloticoccus primus]
MNKRLPLLAVAALLGLAPLAHAHSVWIEDNAARQLVVRFGQVGESYETSPGYLDELYLSSAWTADADGKLDPLKIEKKSDHYLLHGATPAQAVLGETSFYVMQHGKSPAIWPILYVRWQPAEAEIPSEPALTLDLLPTGRPGEVRVYFRGKPLPGAVVSVASEENADHSTPKLTADAEGIVRYTPKGPGLVVLTSNHREALPGYTRGKTYELVSHTGAISWRQE